MILPKSFGDRLSLAMREKRKTRGEVAERLGVTRGAVGHWASGRRTAPDPATIEVIATTLGVRAAWLSFGEGPMCDGVQADAPQPPTDPTPRRRKAPPAAAPKARAARATPGADRRPRASAATERAAA